ncbi:MAG: Panacea domain-containing protein [Gammaproteobacteria bacterium]
MTYKALEVANTFIGFGLRDRKPVTHMQLQKLLYYAQGWYLALGGMPLFDEEFKKWPFGPVCPPVYNKLKKMGGSPITTYIPGAQQKITDPDILKYLEKIWNIYGHYSGPQLMMLSHSETPWVKAEEYDLISKESLKAFFKNKEDEFISTERC